MGPTAITAVVGPAGAALPLQEHQTGVACAGKHPRDETGRCHAGNDVHQARNRGQEHARRQSGSGFIMDRRP